VWRYTSTTPSTGTTLPYSSFLPLEVLGRVGTVHLGHEVADERLLIESRVVGAQEVVPGSEQTVVVHLTNIKRCVTDMISDLIRP
jgi:hypothetical protein